MTDEDREFLIEAIELIVQGQWISIQAMMRIQRRLKAAKPSGDDT